MAIQKDANKLTLDRIREEIDHLIDLRKQAELELQKIRLSVGHYKGQLTRLKNQVKNGNTKD